MAEPRESASSLLPLIVAHRGASHDAPENTLAAFELAWQQGADAIEGDFRLSADGRILCHHDATTRRTARTTCSIAKTNWARLRELDVGGWKNEAFAGQRIPLLEEVLETIPTGKRLFFEAKCGAEIVAPLCRVLDGCGFDPARLTLIAFDAAVVARTKAVIPGAQALLLVDYHRRIKGWSPRVRTILHRLAACGADGLGSENHEALDRNLAESLKKEHLSLNVWTVDEPLQARRYIGLGADSLTTNRPGWLRGQLLVPEG